MDATTETQNELVKCLCPKCDGGGFLNPDADYKDQRFCPVCNGLGIVSRPAKETIPCPACEGIGKEDHTPPCPDCAGTGRKADPAAPFLNAQQKPAVTAKTRLANIEARLTRLEQIAGI